MTGNTNSLTSVSYYEDVVKILFKLANALNISINLE